MSSQSQFLIPRIKKSYVANRNAPKTNSSLETESHWTNYIKDGQKKTLSNRHIWQQCHLLRQNKNRRVATLIPYHIPNFKSVGKVQGDPFKMSQTSGVAPCKRRFYSANQIRHVTR